MSKKIYRTIIRYEILSEAPFDGQCGEDEDLLAFISRKCIQEDWSGRFLDEERINEELTGRAAVAAIEDQGSDPEFFGMNKEGENLEEEDEDE